MPTASSTRICHPTTSCVCVCVFVCERRSVVPDSLQPHGLWPASLLSLEFSRQEYWSGLPFSAPEDLPSPGIKPSLLHCRQVFLSSKPLGKARLISTCNIPDILIEGMREIQKNLRNQPKIHDLGKAEE